MLHRLTFMAAIILTGNSAAAANKYNTIQLHKYNTIQIYKYTNTQIHKYTNTQIQIEMFDCNVTRNSAVNSEIQ